MQRKKEYGNAEQHEYIEWLSQFAKLVRRKLREDGSFVKEFAEDKAWEIYREIMAGGMVDFRKGYRARQAGVFEVAV